MPLAGEAGGIIILKIGIIGREGVPVDVQRGKQGGEKKEARK